jgi:hypothetical protein
MLEAEKSSPSSRGGTEMAAVIGLFRNEVDVSAAIQKLNQAGFPQESIEIQTNPSLIKGLLGCKATKTVTKYAAWGALFGIAVYLIFTLVAGWCECTIFGFGRNLAFIIVLAGLLIGTIIGALMGCLVGVDQYEKDTHLYVQGMRQGGRLIIVQASEADAKRVQSLLEQERISGVRTLCWREP